MRTQSGMNLFSDMHKDDMDDAHWRQGRYICMYVCMYVYCMYVLTGIGVCTCVYMCGFIHSHGDLLRQGYVHTREMCIRVHVFICLYVCVCVFLYLCMSI